MPELFCFSRWSALFIRKSWRKSCGERPVSDTSFLYSCGRLTPISLLSLLRLNCSSDKLASAILIIIDKNSSSFDWSDFRMDESGVIKSLLQSFLTSDEIIIWLCCALRLRQWASLIASLKKSPLTVTGWEAHMPILKMSWGHLVSLVKRSCWICKAHRTACAG